MSYPAEHTDIQFNELLVALKTCYEAMQLSLDYGYTAHLDTDESGGEFWYHATRLAKALLDKYKDAK